MDITILPIVASVKDVHPKKAFFPISTTLSGITTLVNEEQPKKAL